MCRTVVNVTGDAVCAVVVASTEGQLAVDARGSQQCVREKNGSGRPSRKVVGAVLRMCMTMNTYVATWCSVTKRRAAFLMVLAVAILAQSVPGRACFSIVVGKNASADGCVLVGHNEDDGAPQIVNHHKVLRKTYPAGAMVTLQTGGSLEQVPQTWACIWSEMPGMPFSDSYVNEWGVTVCSDNCPSREDRPELTDGGIGWDLRRLVAQRAKTAREGVLLAGQLVERFGYVDSGRTYIIADPNEGWLFCVVNGKHWLAQRVPDDEVAMVANTYTVREVILGNKANVLASKDILDYAKSRGWYDPADADRSISPRSMRIRRRPPSQQHGPAVERIAIHRPQPLDGGAEPAFFRRSRSTS